MGIYKGFLPVLMLIILLSGALKTLAQIVTPDKKVCIGSTYRYGVNGSPGSIYTWKVDSVFQKRASGDFLEYTWTRTGLYTIEVQEHQDGCDGDFQQYVVRVSIDADCGCKLFIPDAFSPNGDGNRDYFEIYCINPYPNARMYIFDQLGNKIYEKAKYGNLDVSTYQNAWWNGKPDRGPGNARNEMVAPGTYYYVLDLGNGEVKKGFVFVSY